MIGKSGYYGKMPSQGDFMHLNLPRGFIDVWDDWQMAAMAYSKEQLGKNWLDTYLTSPIYRFILSSGICGQYTVIGVSMPSVDSVGRYYPLVLGAAMNDISPFNVINQTTWFDQAENLILSVLNDDFNRDNFTQAIKGLDTILPNANNSVSTQPYTGNHSPMGKSIQIRKPFSSTEELPEQMPNILHELLSEYCHAYSLWWTSGSEHVAPSFLISQGLPTLEGTPALLSGHWIPGGWLDTSSEPPQKNPCRSI